MTLVAESLPQFINTTNCYQLGDQFVLVSVPDVDAIAKLAIPGVPSLVSVASPPMPTEVFLCDENAQPIDADGDPTNGLTPLVRLAPGTTHDEALVQAEKYLLA